VNLDQFVHEHPRVGCVGKNLLQFLVQELDWPGPINLFVNRWKTKLQKGLQVNLQRNFTSCVIGMVHHMNF
jgi:hypothetical protein